MTVCGVISKGWARLSLPLCVRVCVCVCVCVQWLTFSRKEAAADMLMVTLLLPTATLQDGGSMNTAHYNSGSLLCPLHYTCGSHTPGVPQCVCTQPPPTHNMVESGLSAMQGLYLHSTDSVCVCVCAPCTHRLWPGCGGSRPQKIQRRICCKSRLQLKNPTQAAILATSALQVPI